MPADTIAKRLREILAHCSGASEAELGSGSTPQNTEGWDSTANLYFIAAIEEEFVVTISTRDVIKLRTLGDFVAYLAARDGVGAET